MRIADTDASVRAGLAWISGGGIRGALAHYGLELEDVAGWSQAGFESILEAVDWGRDPDVLEGRLIGAVAAAMIIGIELERSGELRR